MRENRCERIDDCCLRSGFFLVVVLSLQQFFSLPFSLSSIPSLFVNLTRSLTSEDFPLHFLPLESTTPWSMEDGKELEYPNNTLTRILTEPVVIL